MQQELCERQAKRLPCPQHTSSVHLLTEDGATEAAGCAQEGRGPLITGGHEQRAEVKGAIISTSLDTQVSTEAQGYGHQACSDSPPGPTVVRLLGTQPGEKQQTSLVQK